MSILWKAAAKKQVEDGTVLLATRLRRNHEQLSTLSKMRQTKQYNGTENTEAMTCKHLCQQRRYPKSISGGPDIRFGATYETHH